MDEPGRMTLELHIKQLGEAVGELSKQLQKLQQTSHEEFEKLGEYRAEDATLEFTLVTSGLIVGKLLWVGNQSLGIRTKSGQDIMLYKHAIAFIQERMG